eukprot:scaffold2170_cov72-Skeletonema_dohrnii-CCMP3373.AAC.1
MPELDRRCEGCLSPRSGGYYRYVTFNAAKTKMPQKLCQLIEPSTREERPDGEDPYYRMVSTIVVEYPPYSELSNDNAFELK